MRTTEARGMHPLIRLVVALAVGLAGPPALEAQMDGVANGEWRYWGGDAGSTRFSPLDQVDASNFEQLELAWLWRGDNFGPTRDFVMRSTPIYANGILYTVAGTRRAVVAIDPGTGETLWTFREPHTERWASSPRQNYGRGVAYAEVDGRGVIYVVTPGFFLHALDALTGRPLEGFGDAVPLAGFGEEGTVDMLRYLDRAHPYDVASGPDPSLGSITTSSPPIVVDGVVIVGNSGHPGLGTQTRIENIPGDVLAFDARTGEHRWTFHVIPRPGEYGHETWENDAWQYVGNINPWAPLSADPELGLVYVPTDAPTNDVYGGFRPGDNLFANSLLALDVQTGERRWHFQIVHHDIWDWDLPVAPILMDLEVDGERIPAVVQNTKFNFAYTFNRETGEPVWPIEERPVPQSQVPGERTSPTQPFPTRPAAYGLQGFTEDDLVDFTPELRARAVELTRDLKPGPLFNPVVHVGNPEGWRAAAICPSFTGGLNIVGGPAADPESGILFAVVIQACSAGAVTPGPERDDGTGPGRGTTPSDWVSGGGGGFGSIEGIPVLKPPYGHITAIDMHSGEHLWQIPNGDTPDRITDHPLLAGVDLPNTGQPSHATVLVTRSLLMYGEGRSGEARFHAVDKRTGERVGTIHLPANTQTAPMTYLHEGSQYIVLPIAGGGLPGSLAAYRLP